MEKLRKKSLELLITEIYLRLASKVSLNLCCRVVKGDGVGRWDDRKGKGKLRAHPKKSAERFE